MSGPNPWVNPPSGRNAQTFDSPTFTGQLKAADGSTATPSYSFTSEAGMGFSRGGSGQVWFNQGGANILQFRSTGLLLASGNQITWNNGTVLTEDAANVLALKNGNNSQEYRVYGGNGGYLSNVIAINELLTIAASATTDSATVVPAGAILLAASVRVTTTIPTAATFTVTTATGGTTLDTAAVSTAANSTDPGTAAGASYRSASTKIRITPNLTPGAATGVVRLCIYYLSVTPPTS